jgi:hypothetical protein
MHVKKCGRPAHHPLFEQPPMTFRRLPDGSRKVVLDTLATVMCAIVEGDEIATEDKGRNAGDVIP